MLDFHRSALRCAVLTAAAIVLGGCSNSSVKLYPVQGTVLYKDKPAEGAQVVLRPPEDPAAPADPTAKDTKAALPIAYGTVAPDGTFNLHTEQGEGAAAGDYVAFVTWYGPNPRDPEQRVSKLPTKYADPEHPIFKVTVKAEKTELEPFKLN
jgi:hypothetical protein